MPDHAADTHGSPPEGGDRKADVFLVLCGVLGGVSFWSTALAETTGVLLLLVAAWYVFFRSGPEVAIRPPRTFPRIAVTLLCVYAAAVLLSIVLSGTSFLPHTGILWHPLLFPAALAVPLKRRSLRAAGMLFLASGAACAVVTVIVNTVRDERGPLYAFTGLTTFTDLLVLAGVVAFALLLPSGRSKSPSWRFALPGLVITIAIIWSAERAPVLAVAAIGSARIAAAGWRPLAAWVIVAGACLALSPSALSGKVETLIHGDPVDRYVVWEEGLKQVPHAPLFGWGPGSYPRVLPAEAWSRFINRAPSSWHNDLLETWLDSGPIAACALAGLLVLGVVRGVRGAVRRPKEKDAPLSSDPGLLFLCLALFGLVGSVVTTSVLGLAFWLILGLALNSPGEGSPLHPEIPRSS